MGNYYLVSTEELYHHGVKGMKWGQHIFGKKARTARKRKRVLKKARVEKAKQKKISEQRRKDFEAGKIKPKDMTIDELREYKLKSELQRDIANLRNETASKTMTAGKRVLGDLFNKGIKPGVEEAAKQLIRDKLVDAGKKALGLTADKPDDPLKALKRDVEEAELRKRKTLVDDFYADRDRKAAKKAETARKEQEKAESARQEKARAERQERTARNVRAAAEAFRDSGATVKDVVDAFYEPVQAVKRAADPAVSAVRTSDTVQLGSRYIAGLLEAPKDDD